MSHKFRDVDEDNIVIKMFAIASLISYYFNNVIFNRYFLLHFDCTFRYNRFCHIRLQLITLSRVVIPSAFKTFKMCEG